MQRLLLALLLTVLFALPALAQDSDTGVDSDVPEPATTEVEQEPEEEIDDSDLDDQSYLDIEDDDFRPSEDIPADQSIPFPTDI